MKRAVKTKKAARLDWRAMGALAALVAVCALLFFPSLSGRTLWETDEARYAEIAREMVESGDWVTPRLNYVKYFEKPPLTYWTVALSFVLFDQSDMSARLMPAVFGSLTVLVVFLLANRIWGWRAGFWSGICLATCFMFFVLSQVLLTDMLLCFGVALSLWGAWELREGRAFGLYAFWVGLSFGFLSKGLLGPGLPIMTVVLYCLLSGEWRLVRMLLRWRGPALFAVLCLPWVIWVSLVNPEFFRFFFIDEHLGRLLTTKHQRHEPFFFYFWVLPAGFFPWIAFLPWAVGAMWAGRAWRAMENRGWLFVAIWLAGMFVFLTLSSSKMLHYALPMLPACALLVGVPLARALEAGWRSASPKGLVLSLLALAIIAAIGGLAPVLAPALNPDIKYSHVGALMLVGPSLAALLALVIFALRKRLWAAVAAPLLIFVAVAAFLGVSAPALDDYRSVAGLVKPIQAGLKPNDLLVNLGDYYHGTPYYSGRRTAIARNWGELDFGRRLDPAADKWFLPDDETLIKRMQNPRQRVLVISEVPAFTRFRDKAKGTPGLLLFEWSRVGDKVLFSNLPPEG